MDERKMCLIVSAVVALGLTVPSRAVGPTPVAVFNFQLTTADPNGQWRWLEKGLADQITTDLTRSRRLAVVARDEMQAVANLLKWVPELAATDRAAMREIRERLRIEYVATGVFAVERGQIRITAQVIDVGSRRELARKDVRGDAKDVLALQKRVSAELLAWFSGASPESILPRLPLWTANVDAAKALYEGMHLYDQGRYGEAWLRFRQASRSDPGYLEARYWVGRMYYFQDRYEHARRAYERFVYMDRAHPRLGDAIKEYLHTHEKLGAPAATLLGLYADLRRRYPDVLVHNELGLSQPVTNRAWLWTREAQVLAELGRHEEATRLASAAVLDVQRQLRWFNWTGWAYRIAMRSAHAYNLETARVLMPRGLRDHYRRESDPRVLQFHPGRVEIVHTFPYPLQVTRTRLKDGRMWYGHANMFFFVLAPDGYAFRNLTFYPIADGTDAKIGCMLHKDSFIQKPCLQVPEARRKGLRFENVPRSGIFHVCVHAHSNSRYRDPKVLFRGVRAVAELDKLGPYGAIDVSSTNTENFSVYVDGWLARKRSGRIGLLRPGTCRLELRPERPEHPYAPLRKTVDVRAGRTTSVVASLPWKPDSPWNSWSTGVLIGKEYPGQTPCLQRTSGTPWIQADAEAIRVFWSYRGDLWSSVSTDGETFSRPAKLPMPISSGWIEEAPVCIRDESGRLLLAFRGDRQGQHQPRVYLCWSRDGRHWSRPTMAADRSVQHFHICQDDRGRFLWADATGRKVTVLRSSNAYDWHQLAEVPLANEAFGVRVLQRDDGCYELIVLEIRYLGEQEITTASEIVARQYLSSDGAAWSDPRDIDRLMERQKEVAVSAAHMKGRTLVAYFRRPIYLEDEWPRLCRERADGTWDVSPDLGGIASHCACMAHHPRWGHMIVWAYPARLGYAETAAGPYFIRGSSVDALFEKRRTGR